MPSLDLDADRIPPLPAALARLIALLEDEESSPKAIAEHLSMEPASTIRVLRTANSAYFGGRGKVSTMSHAVLILGLDALRAIFLASEVQRLLPPPEGIEPTTFWRGAFRRAAICQWAVRWASTKPSNHDTAFISSLLSVVGALVLSAEERADPTTCREASLALARRWRLPEEVVEALEGGDVSNPLVAALALALDLEGRELEDLHAEDAAVAEGLDLDRLRTRIAEGESAIVSAIALVD